MNVQTRAESRYVSSLPTLLCQRIAVTRHYLAVQSNQVTGYQRKCDSMIVPARWLADHVEAEGSRPPSSMTRDLISILDFGSFDLAQEGFGF